MKKTVLKLLPETVHTQIVYTGRKLCAYFQMKGKSKFDHLHDLLYHVKYHCELCNENYIGEWHGCIAKRIKDHNGMEYTN